MYLDCDTTPPLRSRYTRKSVAQAKRLIASATEGQIGLYENACGSNFHGYVIKRAGQEPQFEPAQAD